VGWDGSVIYDRPFTSKVNNTRDRTNREASKMAFAKLYPKAEFSSWQITSVFELVSISSTSENTTRVSPSFECHFTTAQDERCFLDGIVDAASPILFGRQKMVAKARSD
jgi:hypothetical protein